MGHPSYSEEFKKSAVKKVLQRGRRSVGSIIDECGVAASTLYKWQQEFANVSDMKKTSKRPQDRSAEEILKAVIEFEKLTEDKRGEFLRKEGLHAEHIELWREQIKAALRPAKQSQAERSERGEDRRKIRELEKELRRKDKALAETTALLVLKKKADLIWGTGDDE
jgi:transposase